MQIAPVVLAQGPSLRSGRHEDLLILCHPELSEGSSARCKEIVCRWRKVLLDDSSAQDDKLLTPAGTACRRPRSRDSPDGCAGSNPTSRGASPRGCPRRRPSWAARRIG